MKISESTTLRVVVYFNEEENVFYRISDAADFVVTQNLVIRSIGTEEGKILVKAEKAGRGLVLRKIEKEDFDGAFELIRECAHEFRPQLSWRGRSIEDMTLNGLVIGKWQAYAYFGEDGRPASYVDSKERVDGEVTLGTVATRKEFRGLGLAAGLLFFHRLLYAASDINSGTYEENVGMRSTFKKAGFVPKHFTDPDTGEDYIFIRDRWNPQYPGDMEKLTNSIYYCVPSLKEGIWKKR